MKELFQKEMGINNGKIEHIRDLYGKED